MQFYYVHNIGRKCSCAISCYGFEDCEGVYGAKYPVQNAIILNLLQFSLLDRKSSCVKAVDGIRQ
jgi:hypothetical protein